VPGSERGGQWLRAFSRPWRATGYLLVRTPLPGLAVGALAICISAGGLRWLTVGVPTTVAYLVLAVVTARTERRAVTLLRQPEIPNPHLDGSGGPVTAIQQRVRAAATWREVGHGAARAVLLPLDLLLLTGWVVCLALVAAPALVGTGPVAAGPFTLRTTGEAWVGAAGGLVVLVLNGFLITAAAGAHAALARAWLGPRGDELREQITDLTRSRLRLIDAFDVERRRIERDLHDGAQQQLTTLAMTLDLARIALEETPHEEASRLVTQAHRQAVNTITELRELIHGIHPPVLTELGLAEAVRVLADRAPIPVRTAIDLPERPPQSVETAVYFVIAEALANAAKHSAATVATLDLRASGGTLILLITDDGVGGADPERGTGLTGLGDRVTAVAGRLTLSSPPGGPTALRAEIPCFATQEGGSPK
jgi:signal transduction histidine kinase